MIHGVKSRNKTPVTTRAATGMVQWFENRSASIPPVHPADDILSGLPRGAWAKYLKIADKPFNGYC
jgi:hypothetical protein